jgi:hypothetical protein
MPQTPVSAFPQTPIPQTPGVAAAQGWMEDIKRVISFDSVEEFWGYVLLRWLTHDDMIFLGYITTSYRHRNYPRRQIITFSRSVAQ